MYLPDLDRLLTVGSTYPSGDTDYVIERRDLGDLVLPTGQVVAGEPMMLTDDMAAFDPSLSPGRYPVVAWVAALQQNGEVSQRRVAALHLVARDEPVVRWEPALLPGQEMTELDEEDAFFGYPVDGGRGGLTDLSTALTAAKWEFDELIAALDPDEDDEIGAKVTIVDQQSGANIIAVYSGWGDGHYPTFAGFTAAGELAALVTDFLALPDED